MTSGHASSPVFLAAPGRPYSNFLSAALENAEGARDARGPGRTQVYAVCANKALGPTDLDASRHRGLSKSELPQVRPTQGVPRAVFVGLIRSAPGGLTVSGNPPLLSDCQAASPPLWAQTKNAALRPAANPAVAGPRGARLARRDVSGFDRRAVPPHLRRNVIPRPPLPVPYLKMLYRHPSVSERDKMDYIQYEEYCQ